MIRSILKNKLLIMSLASFCFSILAFVIIGYAWFAISQDAKVDEFVGVVGDHTFEYQFSKVVDDNLIHEDDYTTERATPGEVNTFVMTIHNVGNIDANINVYFSEIFSERWNGEEFVKEYEHRYDKIQYSYSYCIPLVVYVPSDLKIENQYDSTLITVPTEEMVNEMGWTTISRSEEYTRFNQVVEEIDGETTNFVDVDNYYLLKDFVLNCKDTDPNKTTILLYFTVKFNSTPIMPNGVEMPENVSFNGEYYANQRFNITNVLIQGMEKNG